MCVYVCLYGSRGRWVRASWIGKQSGDAGYLRVTSRAGMELSKSMMPTEQLAPRLDLGLVASYIVHHGRGGLGKVEVLKKGCALAGHAGSQVFALVAPRDASILAIPSFLRHDFHSRFSPYPYLSL